MTSLQQLLAIDQLLTELRTMQLATAAYDNRFCLVAVLQPVYMERYSSIVDDWVPAKMDDLQDVDAFRFFDPRGKELYSALKAPKALAELTYNRLRVKEYLQLPLV